MISKRYRMYALQILRLSWGLNTVGNMFKPNGKSCFKTNLKKTRLTIWGVTNFKKCVLAYLIGNLSFEK